MLQRNYIFFPKRSIPWDLLISGKRQNVGHVKLTILFSGLALLMCTLGLCCCTMKEMGLSISCCKDAVRTPACSRQATLQKLLRIIWFWGLILMSSIVLPFQLLTLMECKHGHYQLQTLTFTLTSIKFRSNLVVCLCIYFINLFMKIYQIFIISIFFILHCF